MSDAPDQYIIDHALEIATMSPCRSKRGVVLYDPATGAHRGSGHNGPPSPHTCPGRAICAGTCGQRSVHAEVRALRAADRYRQLGHPPGPYDLVHVELAPGPYAIDVARSPDGLPIGQAPHVVTRHVLPCGGPSCPGCAAQILDAGFVGGVWLYELPTVAEANAVGVTRADDPRFPGLARWRRYTAEDFYRVTMERCRRPA